MTYEPGPISRRRGEIVTALLGEVDFLLLTVDPGHPGVVLPAEVTTPGHPVGLHLGWRLPVPVPDLVVDERGIRGTLSFNRAPFLCVIPWGAVVQVSIEEEHLFWVTPVPQPADAPTSASPDKDRPKLRLV